MQEEYLKTLIKQIAFHGDKKSFEQLFLHFYDHLYRFAYHFLHNKESAEELVSDVFMSVWQKRQKLHQIQNIKVYLYVVVKNHAINYQKKHNKSPFLPVGVHTLTNVGQPDNPESEMLTQELKKEIEEAIEELPARCRMIFEMIRIDGLKYKEVAQILDISVKTVESQIKIAVEKLAVRLAHHLHNTKKQHIIKAGLETLILMSLTCLRLLTAN